MKTTYRENVSMESDFIDMFGLWQIQAPEKRFGPEERTQPILPQSQSTMRPAREPRDRPGRSGGDVVGERRRCLGTAIAASGTQIVPVGDEDVRGRPYLVMITDSCTAPS